jgi:hypothetical protein
MMGHDTSDGGGAQSRVANTREPWAIGSARALRRAPLVVAPPPVRAVDAACGVDKVTISVLRRHGRKCRNLTSKKRLGRRTRCSKRRWLPVRGATRWSFRLPKKLPRGRYVIRTRAVDFAGNVQVPHARRLRLR